MINIIRKKEYVIAAAIVVLGICASAVILHRPQPSVAPTESVGENGQTATTRPDIGDVSEQYTVIFTDGEGTDLSMEQVPYGHMAIPYPTVNLPGRVFTGWSGSFDQVTSDTQCRPATVDLRKKTNGIYADACYAPAGSEVTVEIKITGRVNLSSLELTAAYDPQIWKAESVSSEVGSASIEDDSIRFSMTNHSLTDDTVLLRAVFQVQERRLMYNELVITVEKVEAVTDGTVHGTDCVVVNGRIYTF